MMRQWWNGVCDRVHEPPNILERFIIFAALANLSHGWQSGILGMIAITFLLVWLFPSDDA
jgi:hypothetical protein